jgi:hypothetical protein
VRSGYVTFVFLATALIVAAGCGGDDPPSAEHAARPPTETPVQLTGRLNDHLLAGEPGEAWLLLHPQQRDAVPSKLFIRCYREQTGSIPLGLVSYTVGRPEPNELVLAGSEVSGRTVPVEYDVFAGVGTNHTFELVAVDGEWRWLLPAAWYEALAGGGCPSLVGP